MKTWHMASLVAVAAGLVLLPAAIASACSSHGTRAGNQIENWVQDNFPGDDADAISVDGNQRNTGEGSSSGGNWDEYYVTITLPSDNGDSVTITTEFQGSGGDTEEHLFTEGVQHILDEWFNDYQPADESDSFVG